MMVSAAAMIARSMVMIIEKVDFLLILFLQSFFKYYIYTEIVSAQKINIACCAFLLSEYQWCN